MSPNAAPAPEGRIYLNDAGDVVGREVYAGRYWSVCHDLPSDTLELFYEGDAMDCGVPVETALEMRADLNRALRRMRK